MLVRQVVAHSLPVFGLGVPCFVVVVKSRLEPLVLTDQFGDTFDLLSGLVLDGLPRVTLVASIVSVEAIAYLVPVIREYPGLAIGLPVHSLHAARQERLLEFLRIVHVADEISTPLLVDSPLGRLRLVVKATLEHVGVGLHVVDDLLLDASRPVGSV